MERSHILGLSNRAILDSINSHFLTPRAVGIKRLPSGDIVVQTSSEEDRKSLETNQKWLTSLGSTGTVLTERYPVFVHAVRIENINLDEQKAIQYLKDENRTFLPNLSIIRAAFPKSALTGAKKYSSLIVELDSPEQANGIIQAGLCEGGEIKRCELFETGCKLTQCFNCQCYGHIARACRQPVRCSYCSKGHTSKDYTVLSDKSKMKCTNCSGQHEAWARTCPTRRQEIGRVQNIYTTRPRFYEVCLKAPLSLASPGGLVNSTANSTTRRLGRSMGATNKRLHTSSIDPHREHPQTLDQIFQNAPTPPTLSTQVPNTQCLPDSSWASTPPQLQQASHKPNETNDW